jgi:YfiH family protein
VIQSAHITSDFTNHGFFGRKYGKSSGLYASLNCSKFVGDDENTVLQNLDIVRDKLHSLKIITPRQQHGDHCILVDQKTDSAVDGDALVTQAPDISIGILTADCAPILFLDKVNRVIGAAHAGWRGALLGVIGATVNKMAELGSNPKNINAAVGPCVSKESYEVDEAFRKNFNNGSDDCFSIIDSKMHFDLSQYCKNRLLEAGLSEGNIDVMGIDTYVNQEEYFSYRIAQKNSNCVCGRQISAICLR